ncbi:MAG: radical SAM protein [Sandaracinaceae bacterium]|nr:radical SAM protein [Sandaracinaceae bacterium]
MDEQLGAAPVDLVDPLTPFVGPMKTELGNRVRAFVEAPGGADVGWRFVPGGLDLRIAMEGGAVQLELRQPASERAGAWRAEGGSVRVRRAWSDAGLQRAPALRRVVAGLLKRHESGTLGLAQLFDVVNRVRPFADVHDRTYRSLEPNTVGRAAILRLGFRCNQDCTFCWQGRDWPSPPEELYWTWLDEIGTIGVDMLTITGEPTLFRRLPELVERAHKIHGLRVSMQTNAIKFAKAEFAERLADAGLEVLLVSLHSADPKVSDSMTRAPGTHVRTIAGVHAALRAGLKVAFNCLVERDNVLQLPELAEYVATEFAAPFPRQVPVVNFSQAGGYHDTERLGSSFVSLDDVRDPLVRATRRLRAAGVSVENFGSCGFPSCVFHDQPDLLPDARRELGAHHMAARTTNTDLCRTCNRVGTCVGVRRNYLERFGEAGLRPFV